jgi:hypothetical protein
MHVGSFARAIIQCPWVEEVEKKKKNEKARKREKK